MLRAALRDRDHVRDLAAARRRRATRSTSRGRRYEHGLHPGVRAAAARGRRRRVRASAGSTATPRRSVDRGRRRRGRATPTAAARGFDHLIAFPPYVVGGPLRRRCRRTTAASSRPTLETRLVAGPRRRLRAGRRRRLPDQAGVPRVPAGRRRRRAHRGRRRRRGRSAPPFDPVSMCIMEMFDKATFAQVPRRADRRPGAPGRACGPDADGDYRVGTVAGLAARQEDARPLPCRCASRPASPFHAGRGVAGDGDRPQGACPACSPTDGHERARFRTIIEPFRIHSIEPMRLTHRRRAPPVSGGAPTTCSSCGPQHVLIDLLTDSGTGAMSRDQWAAIQHGDESYAGSPSYFDLQDGGPGAVPRFPHVIPTHQGRAAERILFTLLGGPGKVVPEQHPLRHDPGQHRVHRRRGGRPDPRVRPGPAGRPSVQGQPRRRGAGGAAGAAGRRRAVRDGHRHQQQRRRPARVAGEPAGGAGGVRPRTASRCSSTPAGSPRTPGSSGSASPARARGPSPTSSARWPRWPTG